MKPAEMLDAAKLAGAVVACYLAWRAYQAAKSGIDTITGAPAAAWDALTNWTWSLGQVPQYTPEQISYAQEQFGSWKSGRGTTYTGGKKATQPARTATTSDTAAHLAQLDTAYGQRSFSEISSGQYDPFNLF
ncbi:MAG: hypothetical protein ACK4MG_14450 [Aquabacterium sp.]